MQSGIVYKIDGRKEFGLFLWEYSPASMIKINGKTLLLDNKSKLLLLFKDADCKEPVLVHGKAQARSYHQSKLTFIKHISHEHILEATE